MAARAKGTDVGRVEIAVEVGRLLNVHRHFLSILAPAWTSCLRSLHHHVRFTATRDLDLKDLAERICILTRRWLARIDIVRYFLRLCLCLLRRDFVHGLDRSCGLGISDSWFRPLSGEAWA